jgi:nicotinate-nucleotide pyrophosphorylase (carboxylating)
LIRAPIAALAGAVEIALAEDLDDAGDITTDAVVPQAEPVKAQIRSRQYGRIAGVDCIAIALSKLPEPAQVAVVARDGSDVVPGEVIARLSGSARTIANRRRH